MLTYNVKYIQVFLIFLCKISTLVILKNSHVVFSYVKLPDTSCENNFGVQLALRCNEAIDIPLIHLVE